MSYIYTTFYTINGVEHRGTRYKQRARAFKSAEIIRRNKLATNIRIRIHDENTGKVFTENALTDIA